MKIRNGKGNAAPGLCKRLALLAGASMLAVALLAPASATAEFLPNFNVSLLHSTDPPSPIRADEVPDLAVTIRQEPQPDCDPPYNDAARRLRCFMYLRKFKIKFPYGWKVNNVYPLTPALGGSIGQCMSSGDPNNNRMAFETEAVDEEQNIIGNLCAENTVIGRVDVEMLNPFTNEMVRGTGKVHLLSSNWNDDPVRLGIYLLAPVAWEGGVFPIPIYGKITLEGQIGEEQIVSVFDGLPDQYAIDSFTFHLTNDNQRGLIRTPVTCDILGTRRINAEIWDLWGARVEGSSNPAVAEDCDLASPLKPRKFKPTMPVTAWPEAAGGHPNLTVALSGTMNSGSEGHESLKNVRFALPQGMVGSLFPFAKGERCGADVQADAWRDGADPCAGFKVGVISSAVVDAAQQRHTVRGSVYLSEPIDYGDLASLRLVALAPKRLDIDGDPATRDSVVLTAGVRLNRDTNRVEVIMRKLPATFEIKYVRFTVDGGPEGAVRPFLTNPTSCSPRSFDATLTSDRNTEHRVINDFQATDCDLLAFSPTFTLDLQDRGPSRTTKAGIAVRQPEGQAHTKAARMFFAQGLRANSEFDGITPCRKADVDGCDTGSKIGTATATSPALEGAPFDTRLRGDLHLMHTETGRPMKVATTLTNDDLPGLKITQQGTLKMARDGGGKFQIVSDLEELPEVPIADFKVSLEKLLRIPWRCGRASLDSRADFRSHSGLSHTSQSSESLEECGVALPYSPGLAFSPQTNVAGAPTGLTVGFSRTASDQTTGDVELRFPRGWAADVLTKPICSNGDANRSACPGGSRIGTVTASARIFKFLPRPNVQGDVYRCEPDGSDTAATCIDLLLPEIAGGDHLRLKGRILVRNNAREIAVVVKDIPVEFDVEMEMEIEGSTTPTFCSANPAGASFTGEAGTVAQATSPYQSSGCDSLNFGPGLNVTHSSTEIERPTSIKTTITNSEGDATMEKINLTFPKELKIDVFKLKSCSNEQRQASSCPSESHLGKAKIETPYLPNALEGDLHFGEAGRIYFDLNGLIKISLDGQIGIDQKSGTLSFTMADIPPLLVSRAEITLDEDKVKNPKECSKATYKATFTSHSGKTSSSQSSVDICGKRPTGEPTFGFKAKLKPQRKKRYTNATFTLTQKGDGLKAIKSLKIKLGKGKRALRVIKSALKRKAKAIGVITLKPEGARAKKAKLSLKRGKVRLRGVGGLKLKLKGKALKLTGLPARPYKRIVIKLNGRKARLLQNPRAKGIVTFAATVGIPGTQAVKLASGVRVGR